MIEYLRCLLVIKPLWLFRCDLERDDEFTGLILPIRLIETSIKAAVVGARCQELGLRQRMVGRQEIELNHIANIRVNVVGHELAPAFDIADVNAVGLRRTVGGACGVAVNGLGWHVGAAGLVG